MVHISASLSFSVISRSKGFNIFRSKAHRSILFIPFFIGGTMFSPFDLGLIGVMKLGGFATHKQCAALMSCAFLGSTLAFLLMRNWATCNDIFEVKFAIIEYKTETTR